LIPPPPALWCACEAVVNIEDPVGKIVGRRRTPAALNVALNSKRVKEEWRAAGYGVRVPRGVFRFRSHEETERWLMGHLARKRVS